LYDLNYKLLNLETIYLISKKYELYEYSLDCLSFTNDPNAVEHINGCWLLYIANIIKVHKAEWTQYLLDNLHKIVNKYNLQQQPWMFDHFQILLYLNKTNIQTHQCPSNTVIVDMMYPIIPQKELIIDYKYLLNQIDPQYKINIIQSIYYLITQKLSNQNVIPQIANNNIYANPRLLTANNQISNTSHSIISSTSNIQDLISDSINYLERQANHHNDTQIIQLIKQFQDLSDNTVI